MSFFQKRTKNDEQKENSKVTSTSVDPNAVSPYYHGESDDVAARLKKDFETFITRLGATRLSSRMFKEKPHDYMFSAREQALCECALLTQLAQLDSNHHLSVESPVSHDEAEIPRQNRLTGG